MKCGATISQQIKEERKTWDEAKVEKPARTLKSLLLLAVYLRYMMMFFITARFSSLFYCVKDRARHKSPTMSRCCQYSRHFALFKNVCFYILRASKLKVVTALVNWDTGLWFHVFKPSWARYRRVNILIVKRCLFNICLATIQTC